LIAADANGFSDPYAIVYYGAQKVKTKVKNKTLDPQWCQTFDIELSYACPLYIEVFDKDLVGSDDFLVRNRSDLPVQYGLTMQSGLGLA